MIHDQQNIPVVILCGGEGTRMREETEFKPKPLVEIGGMPVLWHIMKIYASYGYKDFILALGYKGHSIKQFFYDYHVLNSDFTIDFSKSDAITRYSKNTIDWRVTLVDTGAKTLKGGRIKRLEPYLGTSERFFMTYGDGVADVDINALLQYHKGHGKTATLTGVRPPSRFGDILVENGRVTEFSEKSQSSTGGIINGGFFVLERGIMDYLSTDEHCDFEFGPLERVVRDGQLMVHEHTGNWECMDNVRDVSHLNKLWEQKKAFWKVWEE